MSVPTIGAAPDYTNVKAKDVVDFHKYSDVDGSSNSQHHTLGASANQASPGNHSHDGGSSVLPLKGTAVTDLASAILALNKLGANS